MSYILDALKRAEQERAQTRAAPTSNSAAQPPTSALRPTTLALAAATIFLAGIGAATVLTRAPNSGSTPTPTPLAMNASPASAAPAVVAPQGVAVADRALPALDAADDALPIGYDSLDDVVPVFQGTAPLTTPTPAPRRTAAPVAVTDDVATASAAPVTPRVRTAPDADAQRPPQLNNMPEAFRQRFPDIVMQVLVYDAEPSKRWLLVNSRRYAEGAMLDQGVRIEHIYSDGVSFSLDDQAVFLPSRR